MSSAARIGILLYPDVEVLDFAGPYEVFTTATRVQRRGGGDAPFEVALIGRWRDAVRARAGLVVQPEATLDDHPRLDVLLVPGGVVDGELAQPRTLEWIARTAPQCAVVSSVCTGVFLLAAAGALPQKLRVTTHWEDIADLRRAQPQLDVVENVRWVDQAAPDGVRYVTSAGISAGIDMSLHLVELLAGRGLALATARQLQFDWTENAG